ncbi:unnamed protein product [Zymoseptoria tritici ST99CH_1E4]|uniref:Uncharacterized protein n=1 Tax=Zymoseptoria tritici ST99CH_1E4 TaxID=1276532 RepID=A0A2H1G4J4_ZYMTR|nr:unnamed protein product [Zymoseptoria tritici ST99CH_1E4]
MPPLTKTQNEMLPRGAIEVWTLEQMNTTLLRLGGRALNWNHIASALNLSSAELTAMRRSLRDLMREMTEAHAGNDDLISSGADGKVYCRAGAPMAIWQHNPSTKENMAQVFDKVVRKMVFRYPEYFKQPDNEEEWDARLIDNKFAGHAIMERLGMAEPLLVWWPGYSQRYNLLLTWIKMEVTAMQGNEFLHDNEERRYKKEGLNNAPRLKKHLDAEAAREKAAKKGRSKHKEKEPELARWMFRKVQVSNSRNDNQVTKFYLTDLVTDQQKVALHAGAERPNFRLFELYRLEAKIGSLPWDNGVEEENEAPRFWLGFTRAGVEFVVNTDDSLGSVFRLCDLDKVEAELVVHFREEDTDLPLEMRTKRWPLE